MVLCARYVHKTPQLLATLSQSHREVEYQSHSETESQLSYPVLLLCDHSLVATRLQMPYSTAIVCKIADYKGIVCTCILMYTAVNFCAENFCWSLSQEVVPLTHIYVLT